MCRKRGRIVLVGVTGLELTRADFYEKELTFQVSCSYGPGRYDPTYEERGQDYPVGFVRWTAERNFEAVLDMMASGASTWPRSSRTGSRSTTPRRRTTPWSRTRRPSASRSAIPMRRSAPPRICCCGVTTALAAGRPPARGRVGVIGAGNFASQVLIPAIKAAGGDIDRRRQPGDVRRHRRRASSARADRRTDRGLVFDEDDIDTVVIATRHDSHAGLREAGPALRQARLRREAARHHRCAARRGRSPRVDGLAADGSPVPAARGRLQPPLRAVTVQDGRLLARRSTAPRRSSSP